MQVILTVKSKLKNNILTGIVNYFIVGLLLSIAIRLLATSFFFVEYCATYSQYLKDISHGLFLILNSIVSSNTTESISFIFLTILLVVLSFTLDIQSVIDFFQRFIKGFQLSPNELFKYEKILLIIFGVTLYQMYFANIIIFFIFLFILFLYCYFRMKNSELSNEENPIAQNNSIDDEPIETIEQIDKIRGHHRYRFIQFIYVIKYLENQITSEHVNKNCKVICLNAPWGSGKTTCQRILINKIDRTKKIIIDFNPWNYSDHTELIRDFFNTLEQEVSKIYFTDSSNSFSKYVELITPFVENFQVPFFSKSSQIIKNLFSIKNKTLAQLKSEIKNKIALVDEKIIIFIDDLDRKTATQLLPIFQMIAIMADFPNIIFILSMDYKKVSQIINKEYGASYNNYLQKIINSKVDLSTFSYDELEAIFLFYLKNKKVEIDNNAGVLFEKFCMSAFAKQAIYIRSLESDLKEENKINSGSYIYARFHEPLSDIFLTHLNRIESYVFEGNLLKNKYEAILNQVCSYQLSTIMDLHSKVIEAMQAFAVEDVKRQIVKITNDFVRTKNNDIYSKFIREQINSGNFNGDIRREINLTKIKNSLFKRNNSSLENIENDIIGKIRMYPEIVDEEIEKIKSVLIPEIIEYILMNYKKVFFEEDIAASEQEIRDWVVSGLVTPRDVKQLLMEITSYATNKKEVITKDEEYILINKIVDYQNFDRI